MVRGGSGLSARSCHRFVRGLPVGAAALPEELLAAVVTEPVPGAVQYILHTKVRGVDLGQGDPCARPLW